MAAAYIYSFFFAILTVEFFLYDDSVDFVIILTCLLMSFNDIKS